MRIKFLVLLAVLCLSAHLASAHKDAAKPEKATAKAEKPAKAEKAKGKPEVVEIEEIQVRKKKEVEKKKEKKKHIEIKREVKKKPGKQIPCTVVTKEEKADCEKDTPAGYKPLFSFKETDHTCDWICDYELLPTAPPPPPKKKVVKKLKEKAPKELKKECSGEKRIRFSNCLVNIKGLIAWGDKTKNFDKKFEKLLQKKAKKAKKPARKAK